MRVLGKKNKKTFYLSILECCKREKKKCKIKFIDRKKSKGTFRRNLIKFFILLEKL